MPEPWAATAAGSAAGGAAHPPLEVDGRGREQQLDLLAQPVSMPHALVKAQRRIKRVQDRVLEPEEGACGRRPRPY